MSFGTSYSLYSDLNQLERLVGSLEGYLKHNELYGSVGGGFFTGGNNPQLTIGAILLRIRRLQALEEQLDANRQKKLHKVVERHNAIQEKFADRYQSKMEREVTSRLTAMGTFFEECGKDMANCARNYNPEVLRRTISQEILNLMEAHNITSEEIDTLVRKTDSRLRKFVRESDFVWDKQLEPAYPKDTFWWMYMKPQP